MDNAPIVLGLMGFFSLVMIGVPLALAVRFTPRWLARTHDRRVAFHGAACETLQRALAQTSPEDANYQRLLTRFNDNRAALQALAPQIAVPAHGQASSSLPLAA